LAALGSSQLGSVEQRGGNLDPRHPTIFGRG
jgi:hypothetical protein